MTLFTKRFWKDALERAVSTFVQAAVTALLLSNDVTSVLNINWLASLSVGLIAGVFSLAKSLYAATKNDTDSASLVIK
jgi:hypothetical protein